MNAVWRDQDGNPVPTPPDDVTAALASGAVLLGLDGKPLPGDSAPHYLVFQTDTDKQIKILNVNSGSQDREAQR